jgi:hypothetical protein
MKKLVIACGVVSVIFAVFHVAFWWVLDWPSSLSYMTADDRMLMQTFNFCMIPLFVFFSYVYLRLPEQMLTTPLGREVLAMNATVYYFRALAELTFGNIHTAESQFFFVLCLAVGAMFTVPVLKRGEAPQEAGSRVPRA